MFHFAFESLTTLQCEGSGAKSVCPNDPSRCAPLNQTQYAAPESLNHSACSAVHLLFRFCGGANQACSHDKECLPICWTDCFPCNSKVRARRCFVRLIRGLSAIQIGCILRTRCVIRCRATAICSWTLVIALLLRRARFHASLHLRYPPFVMRDCACRTHPKRFENLHIDFFAA